MKYKLIISDYGETLVNTGEDVQQANLDAIRAFQNQGGIFSIATGREWPSIKRKIDKWNLKDFQSMPIICCYGSLVILSDSNKIIRDYPIELCCVKELVGFLSSNDIPHALVTQNETLVNLHANLSNYSWKQYGNQRNFKNNNEMFEYLNVHKDKIYKIDVYSLENYDLIMENVNKVFLNKLISYINKSGFVEFVSYKAGKEQAYNFLKGYFKLKDNEIVVVGDAPNDLGLFKHALNRVAVSNAIEEILLASTYVIENTDYLGISRLINNVLEGEIL